LIWKTSGEIYELIRTASHELEDLVQLSQDQCLLILNFFKWNLEIAKLRYYEDELKIRNECGIVPKFIA